MTRRKAMESVRAELFESLVTGLAFNEQYIDFNHKALQSMVDRLSERNINRKHEDTNSNKVMSRKIRMRLVANFIRAIMGRSIGVDNGLLFEISKENKASFQTNELLYLIEILIP